MIFVGDKLPVLIGIIYAFFPILSTPLILVGLYLDKKNTTAYLFGIVFNLALIGYYYTPDVSKDLYRHFITVYNLSSTGDMLADPLIVKNIWFYLIGITQNYSLLPFSAIFLTYFIVTKNVFDFGKRENISHSLIASMALLIIIMWPLIWPMSVVRFSVMLVLFFHGLYRELVQGKKNWKTYMLYISVCFIHYAALVLLAIRIALAVSKKKSIVIALALTWGFFINGFIFILNKINLPYFVGLTSKVARYDDFARDTSYTILTGLIFISYSVILILSYYILNRRYHDIYEKYERFFDYGLLISMFSIGSIYYSELIINRFGYLVMIFLLLILMILMKHDKSKILRYLYWSYLPVIVLVGSFLQYVKLKSTVYTLSLNDYLIKNIIDLLIK